VSPDVNPEWWKELFDEVYLATDARTVCDEEVTRREIDLIMELIPLSPEQEILDLCGGHGRHSMELFHRGFRKCTVFDYSQFLIDRGRVEAEREGREITFLQGDARKTGLPPERFDRVLVLGNSLGYHSSPEGDRDLLAEAMRLLRSGGRLLLDTVNGETLRGRFHPVAWHEIGDDLVVCRNRTLDGDVVLTREVVVSKKSGLIKDSRYSLRLYEPDSMRDLLSGVGFSGIDVTRDFSPFREKGDLGFMNFRMIVTATKP
jgi:D-alanine-D-alanine ligase